MGGTSSAQPAPVNSTRDSGTFTWPARNSALLPAIHRLLCRRSASPQPLALRVLILGVGVVRPVGFSPEFIELTALLRQQPTHFTVLDHSDDALSALGFKTYYTPSGYVPGDEADIRGRLESMAALLEGTSAAAGQDCKQLSLDVVCSAGLQEGRTITLPENRLHTVDPRLSDFETTFLTGCGTHSLSQGSFDLVVALNSLWYCGARPSVDKALLFESVLRVVHESGSMFIDEETEAMFRGCQDKNIKIVQWGKELFELRNR